MSRLGRVGRLSRTVATVTLGRVSSFWRGGRPVGPAGPLSAQRCVGAPPLGAVDPAREVDRGPRPRRPRCPAADTAHPVPGGRTGPPGRQRPRPHRDAPERRSLGQRVPLRPRRRQLPDRRHRRGRRVGTAGRSRACRPRAGRSLARAVPRHRQGDGRASASRPTTTASAAAREPSSSFGAPGTSSGVCRSCASSTSPGRRRGRPPPRRRHQPFERTRSRRSRTSSST
jgi:hypothetical protein